MIDMIIEVKSKEPTEKIEKLPETGNYFMMIDSCDHGIFVKQLEMSSTNLSLYKRLNFQATLF